MMYNYPFFNFSGLKRYSNYSPYYRYTNLPNKKEPLSKPSNFHRGYILQNKKNSPPNAQEEVRKVDHFLKNSEHMEDSFFEIFGLKLYYDDILLICLIFFLYQEGNQDQYLLIALVLLLLS